MKSTFQSIKDLFQSKNPRESTLALITTIILLTIWLGLVIFTETQHEFWRDEIRALTLAQSAQNPLDLFRLIRYEGHPFLWFFVLYLANLIFHSNLILPVLSILIAFAAVCLFLFKSPFPFWVKILFLFSAFPLYEYSVMARNYGISMLLLFLIALLFPKKEKQPILFACIIALLANTNIHSVILAVLIVFLWLWDLVKNKTPLLNIKLSFAGLIIILGVLLSIIVVFPKENSILVQSSQTITKQILFDGLIRAVFRPDLSFNQLLPEIFPNFLVVGLIFLSLLGLLCKPQLLIAGLGALIGLGFTFQVIYSGSFRHQGLFFIFIVFLYWINFESRTSPSKATWLETITKIGTVAGVIMLIGNSLLFKTTTWLDITTPASASKQFGEFLTASTEFNDAILLPEPDFMLESLPYYTDNPIFFVRENQFGKTVAWEENAQRNLTLGSLLDSAQKLQTTTDVPILIILGHWDADFEKPGQVIYSYNKVFSWDQADAQRFSEITEFVTEFSPAFTGEKYRVYKLLPNN